MEMEITFRIIWHRVNSPIHLIQRCIKAGWCRRQLQRGIRHQLMLPPFCQITLAPKQPLFYTPDNDKNMIFLLCQPSLQGEHQKPGESGILPPSHQVPPLQFEVSLVPSLHHHQPGVGGSFPGHVLITCEGWNHWPAVENQAHLRKTGEKIEQVSRWDG